MNDLINGSFELLAGVMILNNCRVLYRDKLVRGVSVWTTVFMSAWAIWNLYYYPSLDQWWSFVGGIVVGVGNVAWVTLAVAYRRLNA